MAIFLQNDPAIYRAGHNVDDGDVVHLSPARYAHINPYGKYRFNVEGEFNRKGLRPLRQPDFASA